MKTRRFHTRLASLLAVPLLLTVLTACPAQVCAASAPAGPVPVLADGWSPGKLFGGVTGRSRVIQFAVVGMCIALFILIRKLAPTDRRG
jgi:hypothetical protein